MQAAGGWQGGRWSLAPTVAPPTAHPAWRTDSQRAFGVALDARRRLRRTFAVVVLVRRWRAWTWRARLRRALDGVLEEDEAVYRRLFVFVWRHSQAGEPSWWESPLEQRYADLLLLLRWLAGPTWRFAAPRT